MGLETLQNRAIRAHMFQEMEVPPQDWVQGVAGPVLPSNQASETYAGLGAVPGLRKWQGKRLVKKLGTQTQVVTNDKYEDTMSVWGDEIRRDQTQQVMNRIGETRNRYNYHWWKLVNQTLVDNPLAYDGQNLFDTDHSDGASGTLNNAITYNAATGAVPTPAEMSEAIINMVTQVQGFKDDQGEPINLDANDFFLVYPVVLNPQVLAALNNGWIQGTSGAIDNTIKALTATTQIRPVSSAYLSLATDMFLIRNTGQLMIRQSELGLSITELDLMHVEDRMEFGLMTIRGIGPGRYQHGVRLRFT